MQSCEPPAALNVLLWPVAPPKNRVGGSPAFSFVFAFQYIGETLDTPAENGGCGYDFASGVHKYLYAQDDPVDGSDPLGHDMWVAQGNTVIGLHQVFDVGKPTGTYVTFEFSLPHGVWSYPGNILHGTQGIYLVSTNSTPPNIQYQYGYLNSTPSQDSEAIGDLIKLIGTSHPYGLCSYECRDFAQGCLMEYAEKYPNEFLPGGPVQIFSGFVNMTTGPSDEIDVNTPTVFIRLSGTVDSL